MAVTDVKDTEAAQTVDITAAVEIAVRVGPASAHSSDCAGLADVALAVLQKPGVYVVAKRLNGLFGHPARLFGAGIGAFDER